MSLAPPCLRRPMPCLWAQRMIRDANLESYAVSWQLRLRSAGSCVPGCSHILDTLAITHTRCWCAAFPTYPRPGADDAVSIESGELTPSLSKRTASGGLDAPRRVGGEP